MARPPSFTLTRTGDTTDLLDVNLILQGTALPGVDYTAPAGVGVNNTLTVSFDAGSDTASVSLPTLSDSVIDPYDSIWAILQPGSGYTIAPVVDRAVAIITAENVVAVPDEKYAQQHFGNSELSSGSGEYRYGKGFAALRSDGSVQAWGENATNNAPQGDGFVQIHSSTGSFSALHKDETITSWGNYYQDNPPPTDSGYKKVFSNLRAFAALKGDGSITAWSDPDKGGSNAPVDSGYLNIYSTMYAFCALKGDGSISSWGSSEYGGSGGPFDDGYTQIASTRGAFAALKDDGTIFAWGDSASGGINPPTGAGYVKIFSNAFAFAAVKEDGSISTWGHAGKGGDEAPSDAGYVQIFSTNGSFAALKPNGSISMWGEYYQESPAPTDSGYVQLFASADGYTAMKADGSIRNFGDTNAAAPSDNGYITVVGGGGPFAAMKPDGTIVTWGNAGGVGDAPPGTGYSQIFANSGAWTAMRNDGSLYSWGNSQFGGGSAPSGNDFVAINNPLTDDRLLFPPSINAVDDVSLHVDSQNTEVLLTGINGPGSGPHDLLVTATSSDASILAAVPVSSGGTNSSRIVTITPEPGMTGTVEVTVTVVDGGLDDDCNHRGRQHLNHDDL